MLHLARVCMPARLLNGHRLQGWPLYAEANVHSPVAELRSAPRGASLLPRRKAARLPVPPRSGEIGQSDGMCVLRQLGGLWQTCRPKRTSQSLSASDRRNLKTNSPAAPRAINFESSPYRAGYRPRLESRT